MFAIRAAHAFDGENFVAGGATPEEIVGNRMALLKRMAESGVRFVSGTDAGITPTKAHGSSASAVAALADVLVVGGDVAHDINALRDVRQVVVRGTTSANATR